MLGDFAKADQAWLDPMLEAIAEHAPLLATGEDATFMNRVALATGQNGDGKKTAKKPKGQSHIRQARKPANKIDPPKTGPMADMLKKLFGNNE